MPACNHPVQGLYNFFESKVIVCVAITLGAIVRFA